MRIAILKPWQWAHRVPRAVSRETVLLACRLWQSRRVLWAVTLVDFKKRYSGSVLGLLWYPLYSALFLAVYSFVFIHVGKAKYENFTPYETVLYIFAGLIPYIGFSEAIASGTSSIKNNIALIKNTIFPAELIPFKQVLVSMLGLFISLSILLLMILPTGRLHSAPDDSGQALVLHWHLLYLPVSLLLLLLSAAAASWVFSALAVLVPDTQYMVNILLLLFMFVSPIGYSLKQIEGAAQYILYANPMTYLTESFRFALLGVRVTPLWVDAVYGACALAAACFCGSFFRRLMPLFTDYE